MIWKRTRLLRVRCCESLVTKVEPVYPEAARMAGTEGMVVLDAVIAPDGSVKRLRPVSRPDLLVQAATDAVQSWKCEPYLSSGEAVEVDTTIAVESAALKRPYSIFSACSKGTPRWSFAETIASPTAEWAGSPSSCHMMFNAGSFHVTVRSCSGA
jgi:TonB family protein